MNKLDAYDSGSNYHFQDKMLDANVPRSVFDLSHLVSTTINNCGSIIPISFFEYLPGDSIELRVRSLIRVMPQVVPLYSRQRLYVHAFASDMSTLYRDFGVFMSRGMTGTEVLQIPTMTSTLFPELSGKKVEAESLGDYLGLPVGASYDDLFKSGVSALPFMMYRRIGRDYFTNTVFWLKDRALFPNDDGDFRLGSDGKLISDSSMSSVRLGSLLYRDYADDYFTSALPFMQRGDAPTLSIPLSGGLTVGAHRVGRNEFFPVVMDGFLYDSQINSVKFKFENPASGSPVFELLRKNYSSDSHLSQSFLDTGDTAVLTTSPDSSLKTSVTLDDLRQLAIAQTELERMARTDGSYGEFGLTFFGVKSRHADSFKPVYIGGTYRSFAFTEVLQTSASTSSSALGQYAGHGVAADNDGYIGRFNATDFGYIMIVASIMPDTYYFEGLDKHWTRTLQSQYFLPDRAKLGLTPILNQEVYFSQDIKKNADLFAYQSPFDEYRYKASRISGKIADSTKLSFFPYTQARRFGSTPAFNESFVKANNVRKDYLFAPSESAYSAQFDIECRAVRPLPYRAIPANIV